MSPSFMKKTMVYLGLLDDEYDEYDDLEDRAPRGFSAATATRVEPRTPEYDQGGEEFSGGMSRVRTIPRESAVPSQPRPAASNVAPRPQAVRAVPVDSTLQPVSAAPSTALPSLVGEHLPTPRVADRGLHLADHVPLRNLELVPDPAGDHVGSDPVLPLPGD